MRFAALAPLVLLVPSVLAQPEAQGPATPPQDVPAQKRTFLEDVSFSLFGGVESGFDGDLDDADGAMSVTRLGAGIGIEFPLGKRNRLTLSASEEFSFYDFDDDVLILGSNEPIDDAATTTVGARVSSRISEHWSLIAGGSLSWAAESGAEWQDSLTPSGILGASYRFSDRLTLGAGGALSFPIEDDARFFPVVLVDWAVTPRIRLSNASSLAGSSLRLSYALCDQWLLFAQGGFERRDFRLNDDSDAPAPDGIFRESRVPVALGVVWRPNAHFTLGVRAGMALGGSIQIDDEDGDELYDDDIGAAPFIGVEASLRF